jgi:hypothetical protein
VIAMPGMSAVPGMAAVGVVTVLVRRGMVGGDGVHVMLMFVRSSLRLVLHLVGCHGHRLVTLGAAVVTPMVMVLM